MDEGRLFRIELLGERGEIELQRRQDHLEHLQNLRQSVLLEGGVPSPELVASIEHAETQVGVFSLAREEVRDRYGDVSPADFQALEDEIAEAQRQQQWEAEQDQREMEMGQEWAQENLSHEPQRTVSNMDEASLEDNSTRGWIFPVPRQKCNMIYGVKKPTINGFDDIHPSGTRQVDNFVQPSASNSISRTLIRILATFLMQREGFRVAREDQDNKCYCLARPSVTSPPGLGMKCAALGEDDIPYPLKWAVPLSYSPSPGGAGKWSFHFIHRMYELNAQEGRHESSCPPEGTENCLYCLASVKGMRYRARYADAREAKGSINDAERTALSMFLKIYKNNPTFPLVDYNDETWSRDDELLAALGVYLPREIPQITGYFTLACATALVANTQTFENTEGPITVGSRYGHIVSLPIRDRILPTMFGAAVVEVLKPEDCPIQTAEELRNKLLDDISLRRNPDIILPGDDLPFVWQSVRDEQTCYRIAFKQPSIRRGQERRKIPIDWTSLTSGVGDRKDWEPSIAEMRGWEQVMPFPPAATEHFLNQEDAFLAVAEYMRHNFAYVCHDELGRWFTECKNELPLIASTLKMGHCDVLSWVAAAYMRQLGLPAVVVSEFVYAGEKRAFYYAGGDARAARPIKVGTYKAAHTHAKVAFLANDGQIRLFDPTMVVPRPRTHYTDRLPPKEVAKFIDSYKRKRKLETKRRVLEEFVHRYPVDRTLGLYPLGYRDEEHQQLLSKFDNYQRHCGPYMAKPHKFEPWDSEDAVIFFNKQEEGHDWDANTNYLLWKYYSQWADWPEMFFNYESRHEFLRIHQFIKGSGIVLQGDWLETGNIISATDIIEEHYKFESALFKQNQALIPTEHYERIYQNIPGAIRHSIVREGWSTRREPAAQKIVMDRTLELLSGEDDTISSSLRLVGSVDELLQKGFNRRFRKIIKELQDRNFQRRKDVLAKYFTLKQRRAIEKHIIVAAMFPRLIALAGRDSRLRRRLEQHFEMKPGQYRKWAEYIIGVDGTARYRPEMELKQIKFDTDSLNDALPISDYRQMFAPEIKNNAMAAHRLLQRATATQRRKLPEDVEWKEYVFGDDYRDIDWKVSARTDKLIVRKPRVGMEPDSPLYVHFDLQNGSIPTRYLRFHAVVEMLRQLKKMSAHRKICISVQRFKPRAYVRLRSHHDPFKFAKLLLLEFPVPNSAYDNRYSGYATQQGLPNIIYITEHKGRAATMQYLLQGPKNHVVSTTFQEAGFAYDDIRLPWLEMGFGLKQKITDDTVDELVIKNLKKRKGKNYLKRLDSHKKRRRRKRP